MSPHLDFFFVLFFCLLFIFIKQFSKCRTLKAVIILQFLEVFQMIETGYTQYIAIVVFDVDKNNGRLIDCHGRAQVDRVSEEFLE